MTIISVKKYLFVGLKKELDLFFKKAQQKGFIEFIPSNEKRNVDHSEKVLELIEAIKILRRQDPKAEGEPAKDLDSDAVSALVIKCGKALEKLEEKTRALEEERRCIEPLGAFDLKEVQAIQNETGWCIQFFCVKKEKIQKIGKRDGLISVGVGNGMEYFMSLSKDPKNFSHMIELHLTKSLEELHFDLEKVREEIETCRKTLEEHALYIDFLKKHLTTALNESHRIHAKEGMTSHLDGALFAIEAWIPQNRLHALFSLLEGVGIHAEEIAIEKGERVPTYLENQSYGKLGEDLIQVYDIPATQDKDPSSWVFWAFAVFFAMIISDAGYGVIFLILALIFRKKCRHIQASSKRFLRLFTVLSAFCIGWGVVSGSYFGLSLSLENPLNRVNIVQALAIKKADYHLKNRDETYADSVKKFPQISKASNGKELLSEAKMEKNGVVRYPLAEDFRDSILMEIALLTGVIHISLSLLRGLRRHFSGFGWTIAIVGAYLFFPKLLNTTSVVHFACLIPKQVGYEWGKQLFFGGAGLAFFASFIQNRWRGLLEFTKLIELFADVLSYIRLYALGLAAMILGGTFNELGGKFGFVLGFFIILIGHAVNIAIGVMGGTIHGLRLNFIEWYHHSFEGGGKLFNPLKLIK